MEHTAGQPETPEEPAVWERPLPWVREAADESGPASASTSTAPVEPTAEPPAAEPAAQAATGGGTGGGDDAGSGTGSGGDGAGSGTGRGGGGAGGQGAEGAGQLFRAPVPRPEQPAARGEQGTPETRPERGARVVGAVVATCVLLVLGLGSVAFMALPHHDDSAPHAAAVGDGTVPRLTAGLSAPPTGTGSASASASGTGRPAHDPKGGKPGKGDGAGTTGDAVTAAHPAHPDEASATKPTSQAAGTGSSSGGGTTTGKAASRPAAPATVPGRAIAGYASSKCIEVSAHAGKDGSPLRLWGCDGDAWQKWVFASDGSVRSMGLCLDIANASQDNGATVQLAVCNGGWAQKFNLNSSHDLVNSVIGKCVDAKDAGTANGTRLQLWDCAGTSNQKWHLA